jgi:hypothetical protein
MVFSLSEISQKWLLFSLVIRKRFGRVLGGYEEFSFGIGSHPGVLDGSLG